MISSPSSKNTLIGLLKTFAVCMIFLGSTQASANTQNSTIIFDKNTKKLSAFAGPKRWRLSHPEIIVSIKENRLSNIKSVLIKPTSQSGFALSLILRDGQKVSAPSLSIAGDECFDVDGVLKNDCFIDLALYDFDSDGSPEVVVSVGDALINQTLYILQYHQPINIAFRNSDKNWTESVLKGQNDCFISREFVSFRMGSRGFTESFFMKNGVFYKEN